MAKNATNHLDSLQSFRGIAALIVLIHHCFFYFKYDSNVKTIVEVVFNAHAAVVAFYVLSGYVLTLSLLKYELNFKNIVNFYIRRVFRIYPALWFAAILATIYLLIFKGFTPSNIVSSWWNPNYTDDFISWFKVFVGYMGFGHELPLPIWSISIELVASLMFPLMIFFLKKNHYLFFVYFIFLLVLAFLSKDIFSKYMFCFSLGSSIVLWNVNLFRNVFLNKYLYYGCIIIAFVALNFSRSLFDWNYANFYHYFYANILESIFAGILIYLISNAKYSIYPLMNKKVIYLGDISYSIYLLHLPIMAFVAFGLDYLSQINVIPRNAYILSILLCLITFSLTVILSSKVYKHIELKFIFIGRKFLI